jgi:RIO-like serine/threonine protein kinase
MTLEERLIDYLQDRFELARHSAVSEVETILEILRRSGVTVPSPTQPTKPKSE